MSDHAESSVSSASISTDKRPAKKTSDETDAAVTGKGPAPKRRRKQKPNDFPKRPLSAYNIFFKEARARIVAENKKEGISLDFQSLAKEIANQWKTLSDVERQRVEDLAKVDLKRYRDEIRSYEGEMVKKSRQEREVSVKKQLPADVGEVGENAGTQNSLDTLDFRNRNYESSPHGQRAVQGECECCLSAYGSGTIPESST